MTRVLFFGTYDASTHPRVAVLRDGLRDHGAAVHEVNTPLGLSTAARVAMLRRPWRLPMLGWRLLRCWASLVVRSRRYRGTARPDAVVVGYLGHFDVLLARRLFRRVPLVLDHLIGAGDTATDRGVAPGLRHRLLRALDEAALRSADLVVVDTEEHRAALPAVHRPRALVVGVGAPEVWFDARAAPPSTGDPAGPLRVVFYGLYTPLQGAPVIGAALAALADAPAHRIEVTMIGAGQDLEETRRLAAGNTRVTWLDWVDPVLLPAVVAGHDVCLGIFGVGPKALRVVPNKVFQGAAAGCALVTSDTPPQRRLLGTAAVLVPPGDAVALATALSSLAADPSHLAAVRKAAGALAETSFTPLTVTTGLLDRVTAVSGRQW